MAKTAANPADKVSTLDVEQERVELARDLAVLIRRKLARSPPVGGPSQRVRPEPEGSRDAEREGSGRPNSRNPRRPSRSGMPSSQA